MKQENISSVKITVFGIVQGVSFRSSTVQQAKSLDLAGWVKNKNDGTVEIWAQGKRKDLEALISWCYEGPSLAKVKDVVVIWENQLKKINDFTIDYL